MIMLTRVLKLLDSSFLLPILFLRLGCVTGHTTDLGTDKVRAGAGAGEMGLGTALTHFVI